MRVKLRPDLVFVQRTAKFDDTWVIKDPVSFNHFLFSTRDFELANLFDGQRSEQEIQTAWQHRFKTSSLTLEQVQDFAARLIRDNLVTVSEFGYGRTLHNANQKREQSKFRSMFLSPLVIRFRGINPGFMLDGLWWLGWLVFHPIVMAFNLMLGFLVLLYMLGHLDDVATRLPAISQLLSTQGILAIILTVSIIKILHELGHAIACERCGGECFEIGVILLAFIPTLYCNVSDAWTFPEKWKRLVVSFAGIYVEIILATIAAVIWMNTPPGVLNAAMFNVVILCSINTLLINGNPLLRYDGYYFLSDLIERPNLSATAKEELGYFTKSLFLKPKFSRRLQGGILLYAILSFLYRWFVVGSIICMLYIFFANIHLRTIGQFALSFVILGILARPLMSFQRKIRNPGSEKWGSFSLARAAFPCTMMLLAALTFFFVPLPSNVRCNLLVEGDSPAAIFVPANGRLAYIAPAYGQVKKGDVVARIESLETDQQLRQVKNDLLRSRNIVEQLKLRANGDPMAAAQIAVSQKNIEAFESRLNVLSEQSSKLTVTAPASGKVYPAPARPKVLQENSITTWTGQLTDAKNKDCYVERGEALLTIQQESQKTITLFVGEREINFVKTGQPVMMMFAQNPKKLFEGSISEIYEVDVDLDETQQADTGMETYQDSAGQLKSFQTPYRVTIDADSIPDSAFIGSGGRARISIPPQTLWKKSIQFAKRIANTKL